MAFPLEGRTFLLQQFSITLSQGFSTPIAMTDGFAFVMDGELGVGANLSQLHNNPVGFGASSRSGTFFAVFANAPGVVFRVVIHDNSAPWQGKKGAIGCRPDVFV
ncbi:hypothetical protein C7B61_12720 [filamentous cyanobacterium CCP1]|nr:hypothetical protein C7B76_08660 [filamentous cyanobacterium CCP2]PSB64004.1 hypothetical protein C7B61_12720 [filamentous cyanobacterium CCP1]